MKLVPVLFHELLDYVLLKASEAGKQDLARVKLISCLRNGIAILVEAL